MITGPGLLPRSGGEPKKLVVFCHGYGSNGEDLLTLAPYWADLLPEAEFLSPNAPENWEAYPSGYQWFSLQEFTPNFIRRGLDGAAPILRDYLLEALRKRALSPKDLAIVGFSQGGMIALEMMYLINGIGGIICYSGGFYPRLGAVLPQPSPKVLLVHGDADMIVPYDYFHETQKELRKLGNDPQTLTCSGLGHSIDSEGLKVGGEFLAQIFVQETSHRYREQ